MLSWLRRAVRAVGQTSGNEVRTDGNSCRIFGHFWTRTCRPADTKRRTCLFPCRSMKSEDPHTTTKAFFSKIFRDRAQFPPGGDVRLETRRSSQSPIPTSSRSIGTIPRILDRKAQAGGRGWKLFARDAQSSGVRYQCWPSAHGAPSVCSSRFGGLGGRGRTWDQKGPSRTWEKQPPSASAYRGLCREGRTEADWERSQQEGRYFLP